MRKFELRVNLLEIQDEKMSYSSYHADFCNITQAAVYVIDFKCEPEAYDVFASMTLAELDGQFLEGSASLPVSRPH